MALRLPRFAGVGTPAPSPDPLAKQVPGFPKPEPGFHGAVCQFKRCLIEATLAQAGGNRTRAALALGLQRTYLLRPMREFQIRFPAAPGPPRRSGSDRVALPPQTR